MPRPCRPATNQILWASAYPLLGAAGFQYRGRKWHRRRPGFDDLVLVWGSRHNSGTRCGFDVLVGLVVPDVYRLTRPDTVTLRDVPDFHEATVRFRAPDPLQPPTDPDDWSADVDWWFDAADPAEVAATGERLADTFRTVILPFFDRRASLQEVYALQDGPPAGIFISSHYRAALDALAGDSAAATRVLQEEYARLAREASPKFVANAQRTLTAFAARLGLPHWTAG